MALRSYEMSGAAEATAGGGKARSVVWKRQAISFHRCAGCMQEKYIIKPGICHFISGHSHAHDTQKGLSHLSL